jgi:hypothetical protein
LNFFLLFLNYLFRAASVERDELKEQVTQLDRDNCQLKFENETLLYRLRQRSMSVSISSDNFKIPPVKSTFIFQPKRQIRKRACSLSLPITTARENEHRARCLSLNCIFYR